MMQIINGKNLAAQIKDQVAKAIFELKGPRPNLAIILIGERPDSQLYVNLKEKQAKTVGIDTHLYKCPENITQAELLEMIEFLNTDPQVDAILVQLPLPQAIDTFQIIEAIDPQKDVDGFHSQNLARLTTESDSNKALIIPPVFAVVLEMLSSIEYDLKAKEICIVANADIFEDNLAALLTKRGAHVEVTKIEDQDLEEKIQIADIVITAVGRARWLTKEMIKQGAVLIDIGITKDESGELCGDVDFEDVAEKAGYASPVPGGVGPMTIAMAFRNTLIAYHNQHPQS
jgi:methylenetetrahydrofolate dehydrogenase (NADP+)/methenyltetrahydrofolate cyclohydrolase